MFSKIVCVMRRVGDVARNFSNSAVRFSNYYELLGVSPTATHEEIKMAYFEKTKLYHPDRAEATESNLKHFRLISEAYEILGAPESRKNYDENVLGLESQVAEKSSEDEIQKYLKLVKRKTNSQDWIHKQYTTLREIQKTNHHQVPRHQSFSEKSLTHDDSDLMFFVTVLVFFTVVGVCVTYQVFYRGNDEDERMRRSKITPT